MTIREKYDLHFEVIARDSNSPIYICRAKHSASLSDALSKILTYLSDREPGYLLTEIQSALDRNVYEEDYTIDGTLLESGSIEILPPVARIRNRSEISLLDLALLLEEWIKFCKESK